MTGGMISVHCWANLDLPLVNAKMVSKWAASLQFLLAVESSKLVFHVHNNNSTGGTATGATPISTGAWYALGGSARSTLTVFKGVRVYVNGSLDNEDSDNGVSMVDTTVPFTIGGGSEASPANLTNGRLAEVALWNVELTANEFAALAKGTSPLMIQRRALQYYWPLWGVSSTEVDLGGNNKPGTVNGTAPLFNHAPVGPPPPMLALAGMSA